MRTDRVNLAGMLPAGVFLQEKSGRPLEYAIFVALLAQRPWEPLLITWDIAGLAIGSINPAAVLLTILEGMKSFFWITALMGCWLCAAAEAVPPEPFIPPFPRVKDDDECKNYSAAEFERLLLQLKSERAALQSEWKALVKRSVPAAPVADSELHVQLRLVLERLQQSRLPAPALLKDPDLGTKPLEPVPPVAKKSDEAVSNPKATPDVAAGPIDALSQAHTLCRARQYEEALAAFRLVDLKGRKAESRAPIQYLMAICLLHLGKAEEALPLLREVANSRGDEKLASYAQWQLEMLRWQRDVQDRLQEQRQRRQNLEKRS
jgi:hypothetical protein